MTPTHTTLNQIYAPVFSSVSYGVFGEVDQYCGTSPGPQRCGDATRNGLKIDYTFDNGGWCCPSATVSDALVTDHDALKGALRLQP